MGGDTSLLTLSGKCIKKESGNGVGTYLLLDIRVPCYNREEGAVSPKCLLLLLELGCVLTPRANSSLTVFIFCKF